MPLKFLKKSRQYDVFSKDFNMFTIVCLGEATVQIYSSVELTSPVLHTNTAEELSA